uniref:Uncharacterized protein n=1 Tax=Panagrolaimus superbus TaxID=310955 RepID=A0A914YYR5_9BILA
MNYLPFVAFHEVFPDLVIRDYVTKENGIIMTSFEQFELFAKILKEKGFDADIYLYQQGKKEHIWKTNVHENPKSIIPVIRLFDGRFAATSIYNCYSFDLENRLLRIETLKARKEKRIKKCKEFNLEYFPNLNF